MVFPLGRWGSWGTASLADPRRRQHGSVIILPGIDGRSLLNLNVALGLADAGVQSCIEVIDWTTGLLPLAPYHLRSRRLHERGACRIAAHISECLDAYPRRPLHLIGHSGGGGMALYALDRLDPGRRVTSAFLLGPAVSPGFDVRPALVKTACGIRNYYSRLDCLFLGAVTSLFGTVDGRHRFSAGAVGFDNSSSATDGEPRLDQREFHPGMVSQFHLGGHFGWTNRVFVAEEIAPRIWAAEMEFAESVH